MVAPAFLCDKNDRGCRKSVKRRAAAPFLMTWFKKIKTAVRI